VTRTEAAEKRRERVLEATAELVAERGYLGLKIAELARRAGVSLLTVGKLFGDKLGCYLAVLANTVVEARRSCEDAHGEPKATEASLGALFEMAATNPVAARACLLEPFAAGEKAIDHHRRMLAELGAALLEGAGGPSETAAIAAGAAVLWLPERCLLDEEPERIPGLTREALEFAIAARAYAEGMPERSRSRLAEGQRRLETRGGSSHGEPAEEAVLGPLPAGRHGLTRAVVQRSQRERLLAAVAEAVAERGYAATRIGDVVERAAVSRRAFYENFESVEECLLDAFEIVVRHLGEIAAEAAAAEEGDPPRRAIAALRAVLDFLAAEPDLARACMVETLAVGAVGQRRYREGVNALAEALRANLAGAQGGSPSAAHAQMAVGSVAMVVSLRIAASHVEDLPSLEPELAELLLGPLAA